MLPCILINSLHMAHNLIFLDFEDICSRKKTCHTFAVAEIFLINKNFVEIPARIKIRKKHGTTFYEKQIYDGYVYAPNEKKFFVKIFKAFLHEKTHNTKAPNWNEAEILKVSLGQRWLTFPKALLTEVFLTVYE